MVTPQQLMDLPSAGMAEKALRRSGLWQLTPLEILWQIPDDHCSNAANDLIDKATAILETAMEATCN